MKVSIIIPIYNAESHLKRCIGSAVEQTYGDLEIILVNDGSTDTSANICRSFADKDPRIVLIDQKNTGVSAARNKALDIATGDLITFIDSDDHVYEDYVEYMVRLFEQYGSDITCTGQIRDQKAEDEPELIEGTEACLKRYLTTNDIFPAVWGKLYKKEVFDGIRFPVGKRYEDNYILFRLLDRCSSVTIGQILKYCYNNNPESFVNQKFTQSQIDLVDAMTEQREFIAKKYPALTQYANAMLVYGANRCLMRMADSGIYKSVYIPRMKLIYKEYGKDYISGEHAGLAKNFCRIARISPTLAMRFYHAFKMVR